MSNPNKSKRYKDEFKLQIVNLYNNGKTVNELVADYQIARSTISKWVSDYNSTKSFKACDNRSSEENELIKLRKENQHLKMEVDILKQAALIIGQK